ncbi:P-loop containing nucleoside triphosphate hydrolase protein [Tothia fuscella]|uniref:P-loop containing nucleoside triphosphate hydrolase protein n=1 Tax=Tothia fuscella TaxID=1048955 RepID=A0A9P4NND7_9PEZI|nr:P-loop containing nucleoside triphosphate hydrolase protein [Tothia fuscella]
MGHYQTAHLPNGESTYCKLDNDDGTQCLIEIHFWPIEQVLRSASCMPPLLKNTDAVLLVYDVCNRQSFDVLREFLKRMADHMDSGHGVSLLIAATKIDLPIEQQRVGNVEASSLAKEFGAAVGECSSKTGEKVDSIFQELVNQIKVARTRQDLITSAQKVDKSPTPSPSRATKKLSKIGTKLLGIWTTKYKDKI